MVRMSMLTELHRSVVFAVPLKLAATSTAKSAVAKIFTIEGLMYVRLTAYAAQTKSAACVVLMAMEAA
jgi:hypothetical protein